MGNREACPRAGLHQDRERDASQVCTTAIMARWGSATSNCSPVPAVLLIRDTKRIIDGSPLVAYKAAQATACPSRKCISTISMRKIVAVGARIRALGGAPICYSDPADVAVDKIVAAVNPKRTAFRLLGPVQPRRVVVRHHQEALETEGGHAHSRQRAGPSAQP